MLRVRQAFKTDFPQHKNAQITENDADDTLQVIGAGFPRTGTSSLKAALEMLGYDPCHHMVECFNKPHQSVVFANLINAKTSPTATPEDLNHAIAGVRAALRGYRAAVDAPTCELYKELLAIFPSVKVILSVRDSDEQWWKSFNDTIGCQLGTLYPVLVYPVGFLRKQQSIVFAFKKRWAALTDGAVGPETFAAHRKLVKEAVPEKQLLEFNVKEGWPRLCEFLEVEVPDVPFPNLNDSKAIQKALFGAQVMGVCMWLLYLVFVVVSVYLVVWPPAGLRKVSAYWS